MSDLDLTGHNGDMHSDISYGHGDADAAPYEPYERTRGTLPPPKTSAADLADQSRGRRPMASRDGSLEAPHPTPKSTTASAGAPRDLLNLRDLIGQSTALLDALPDATLICDHDGRVVYRNAAAHALIGLEADASSPFGHRDLAERLKALGARTLDGRPLTPDDLVLTRALRGETVPGSRASTYHITTLDGREVYLRFSGGPICREDGRVVGALVTGHDMSGQFEGERRQEATRRAYETQSARFRTLLDLLPAGVAIYDASGELVDLNAAGQALTQRQVLPGEAAPDRQARYRMRHADGSPMPEEESPSGRSRRGLAFADLEYVIDGIHGPETHILTSGAPLPPEVPLTESGRAEGGLAEDVAPGQHSGSVVVFQDVTELRRVERLAREQADLAEGIIESSPFGIALFDVSDEFRCLRHNDPYLDLVGADLRARGSLVGVPLDRFFDTESAERTRALFTQVRDTGESLQADEYEAVLPPDDTPRVFRCSLRPLRDARGAVAAIVVSAAEITHEVRSRREAESLARRLQTVLDVMPLAVAIVDADGRMLSVNEAFRQFWGRDVPLAESITGYDVFEGWWPDGRSIAPTEWAVARALQHGEVVASEEVTVQTSRGERKTILNSAAPVLDEAGHVTGGVFAFLDITSRRYLEERTSEALDALLVLAATLVSGHSMPSHEDAASLPAAQAGASTALGAMMRRVAALAARTLGCGRVAIATVDATTDTMTPIVSLGLAPEQEARWWRDWAPGTPIAARLGPSVVARLRAGQVAYIEPIVPRARRRLAADAEGSLLVAPMRIDARLVGLLVFDDTQTGDAFTTRDEALASAVGQLAALVVERERLVREHAAADARVLALSETNRLMNEFLGIAGHELRTPLTSVRINAQLAMMAAQHAQARGHMDPELTATFERIESVTERIAFQSRRQERLVNDLLDISRLDTGRLQLRMRVVDLAALVRDAIEEQRVLNPGRVITLHAGPRDEDGEVAWQPSGLPVMADSDRVSQVITNFVTNALKYSPPNAPIMVTIEREDEWARLSVRDFGPGIAAEQHTSVWQRFHRVPGIDVQSGSGIGLGLGLYICHELIERHGGKVALSSVLGEGSTFSFSLPLA